MRHASRPRIAPAALVPALIAFAALPLAGCGRGGPDDGPPPPLVSLEAPKGEVQDVPELFAWQPVAGAASYRVTVGDADTVWPLVMASTTEARLPLPPDKREAIRPGRIHEWSVEALDAGGAVIGSGTVRFWVASSASAAAGTDPVRPAAQPLPALALARPDGSAIDPLAPAGDGRAPLATVFFFTRTDCPIANRYAPEMKRLVDAYGPKGIAFFMVYVDPGESAEAIGRHLAEYGLPLAPLRDPRHELVAATGAKVTPTAAVVTRDRRLVYRGRIDDRYPGFGKALREPSERDLVAALDAVLAGRAVPRSETEAIGCLIGDVAP